MRKLIILLLTFIPVGLFSQNRIVHGEYWFDTDLASSTPMVIMPSSTINYTADIDVSFLNDGLHVIHLRFSDDSLRWSPAVSRYFVKETIGGSVTTAELTSVSYWFNNDIESATEVNISGSDVYNFEQDISVSSLPDGLHTVHFRFADSRGLWSSTISKFFVKSTFQGPSGDRLITGFEYWFDNDISGLSTIPASGRLVSINESIDVSSLRDGLHTLTVRSVDDRGLSSPAVSRFFIKRSIEPTGDNTITGYRYWINDTLIHSKTFAEEAASVVMLDTIDMRLYPRGEYTLNFQFRDKWGLWSSAAFDTVMKVSFPYAVLSADMEELCANDSVLFVAEIIDADSLSWDFGDGNIADSSAIKHSYTTGGDYTVSISVTDTVNDINNLYYLPSTIKVHELPLIDLGDDIDLCEGASVTLNGPSGMSSWDWSSGETTDAIIASSGGRYYLVVQDMNGCSNSDSIDVIIRPLPLVEIGDTLSLDDNESTELNAGTGFTTYLWNDIPGSNLYTINGADLGVGVHLIRLMVENQYGCSDSDTLQVTVSVADGIDEVFDATLKIYPNPFTEYLSIDWEQGRYYRPTISLVDLSGRVYISRLSINPGERIDMSVLPSGKYILIINIEDSIKSLPVIKL